MKSSYLDCSPYLRSYYSCIPSPTLYSLSISNHFPNLATILIDSENINIDDDRKNCTTTNEIIEVKQERVFGSLTHEYADDGMDVQDSGNLDQGMECATDIPSRNQIHDTTSELVSRSSPVGLSNQLCPTDDSPVPERGRRGRKRGGAASKPPRGRPRKKAVEDVDYQELVQDSPKKSPQKGVKASSSRNPSPRDIFSHLSLDSLQIPLDSSASQKLEFPLRSSSLLEWNITPEEKSPANLLPTFWEEPSQEAFLVLPEEGPAFGDQLLENPPSMTHASYLLDTTSLPLLSINNTRSWSPTNTKKDVNLEELDVQVSENLPEDIMNQKDGEDDEKIISSFVDKYLNLNSSFAGAIGSKADLQIQRGWQFLSSLPSRSQSHPPIPRQLPSYNSEQIEYRTPSEMANIIASHPNVPSYSQISDTASSHESASIDFSEYFSPDEINDIMNLVHDDHQDLPPPPPSHSENQAAISHASVPLSQLTIYRTTPPKRGRKRKYDPNKPTKPARQRTSSLEIKSSQSVDAFSYHSNQNGNGKGYQSQPHILSPEDEQYLFSQYHSAQGRQYSHSPSLGYPPYHDQQPLYSTYDPQSYPFGNDGSYQSNGEAKLQGLVGLKLVLNSVRTPSFSRSSSYGQRPPSHGSYRPSSEHIPMNRADYPSSST